MRNMRLTSYFHKQWQLNRTRYCAWSTKNLEKFMQGQKNANEYFMSPGLNKWDNRLKTVNKFQWQHLADRMSNILKFQNILFRKLSLIQRMYMNLDVCATSTPGTTCTCIFNLRKQRNEEHLKAESMCMVTCWYRQRHASVDDVL